MEKLDKKEIKKFLQMLFPSMSQRGFDASVELLEKTFLVSPTQRYDITGSYDYEGIKNKFDGVFTVDKNSIISGKILDPNSTEHNHFVYGNIISKEKNVLDFYKVPSNPIYAIIRYYLEKEDKSDIVGSYSGIWFFAEQADKIDLSGYVEEHTNNTEIIIKNNS